MFLCELCGKSTGEKEPTANWKLTETFGDFALTFTVSATKKLCDECIKSFVVTKSENLQVPIQEKFMPNPEPIVPKKRGKK